MSDSNTSLLGLQKRLLSTVESKVVGLGLSKVDTKRPIQYYSIWLRVGCEEPRMVKRTMQGDIFYGRRPSHNLTHNRIQLGSLLSLVACTRTRDHESNHCKAQMPKACVYTTEITVSCVMRVDLDSTPRQPDHVGFQTIPPLSISISQCLPAPRYSCIARLAAA